MILGGALISAQIDPRQMAGIPRPVNDVPNGTVSVRLIRGQLTNNITDFPVELHVGEQVRTVKTDAAGRAEFGNLPARATLKAVAVVDGERLESQSFPAPEQGGIRLMLVATDRSKGAAAANVPAVAGTVVIGGQTRIIVEPAEESLAVYYLLDVINKSASPVNPATPFTFDMPSGSSGTSLLEGSSPLATANGPTIEVTGPFPPGRTAVLAATRVAVDSGSYDLTQRFPAAIENLAVVVKKLGDTKLTSPQLERQQDMAAQGETFIAATGGAVPAGQPVVMTLSNLPHHNAVPQWTALALAGVIVVAGAWMARRDEDEGARVAERRRLEAKREKLLSDLVRLENERRAGKVADARYESRREALLVSLEQVYGALDSDELGPGPADRSGLAA